jgi:hypothetical protein
LEWSSRNGGGWCLTLHGAAGAAAWRWGRVRRRRNLVIQKNLHMNILKKKLDDILLEQTVYYLFKYIISNLGAHKHSTHPDE